ncbi:50S ribosomal protein L35 [Cucumis melo var. makuwa]|uniref:50S ribosomal protein L35 n=1 Tax=Cucumis melo var. makuwa TaxID=1194695 RepID=A0A5A7VRB4_CUCMM|nr:50S ribosomal protein L35 [Cucumis melo var. makuwa]TYK21070.1 50S ribosomal protein L35 [Cucumis melo var. makuwa]
MLRWCAKLRSAAAKPSQIVKSVSSTRRIFHSAPSLYQPLHFSPNNLNSRSLFNAQTHSPLAAYQCIRSSLLPLSVVQVRHVSSRDRRNKRKPTTPATSKLKKTKLKAYSSYKSRFWLMKDGSIKRRMEGKRHNAHSKLPHVHYNFLWV